MRCDEIEELLSSYIDREVSETQARLVEEHLAGCAECAQTLAALERVAAELGALPPVEMSVDAQDRLAAAIDRGLAASPGSAHAPRPANAPSAKTPWWRVFARPAFVSSAGAFAVIVFALAVWQSPGQKATNELQAPALQSAPPADAPPRAGELKTIAPESGAQSEGEAGYAPPAVGNAHDKSSNLLNDSVYRSYKRADLDKMADAAGAAEARASRRDKDYREAPAAPGDSTSLLFSGYEGDFARKIDARAAAETAAANKPAKLISATLGLFEERVAWVVVIKLDEQPGRYIAAAVDAGDGRLLYRTEK